MEALLSPSNDYVTDLKQIESLSYKNYKKNLDFSNWLKTQDSEKIDALVKEIYQQVCNGIDCTACGNCCKALIVAPDYRDISLLAEHLGMQTCDFKKKYMKKDFEGEMVFKQKPCLFLKNNKCSVYEKRPGLCRKYPYLDQGNILANMGRMLANLYVCPIVFNTYELLKLRFSSSPTKFRPDIVGFKKLEVK